MKFEDPQLRIIPVAEIATTEISTSGSNEGGGDGGGDGNQVAARVTYPSTINGALGKVADQK